jgi:hypothetical protein
MLRCSSLVASLVCALVAYVSFECPIARATPHTMARAELYKVFGGQTVNYCCTNVTQCISGSTVCSTQSGTKSTTCTAYGTGQLIFGEP